MALDLSLVDKPSEPSSFTYTWKDTVLYALGVGAKKDELDWLYEGRGPKVLPSFAVVPMFQPMLDCVAKTGGDLAMVVHGNQRVRVYGDIPPAVMANRYRQLVPERPAFKNFERWFAAIAARPAFKNQVAAVALA